MSKEIKNTLTKDEKKAALETKKAATVKRNEAYKSSKDAVKTHYANDVFSITGLLRWAQSTDETKGYTVISKHINILKARFSNELLTAELSINKLTVKQLILNLKYSEKNTFKLNEDNSLLITARSKFSINHLLTAIERILKGNFIDETVKTEFDAEKLKSILAAKKAASKKAKALKLGLETLAAKAAAAAAKAAATKAAKAAK